LLGDVGVSQTDGSLTRKAATTPGDRAWRRTRATRALGVASHQRTQSDDKHKGEQVIILGIILLIVGFIAKVAIIWTIGIILVVVGAILFLLGTMGRAVGGRRHYF
jgi:Flp pilus assembly protein TadB